MILRALDVTSAPERHEIREGRAETDVGRSPECSIVLPSKSVSRVHARFRRRATELTLEDLGSSNGTAVNGAPIREVVTVRAGDRIRFGSLEFVLEEPATSAAGEGETVLAAPRREAPGPPSAAATADGLPQPASPIATVDGTPSPPVTASTIDGTPSPSQPAAAQREPTSPTVAPAAKPTAGKPRSAPAASSRASALELALIACAAYVAVIVVGFALRWVFG